MNLKSKSVTMPSLAIHGMLLIFWISLGLADNTTFSGCRIRPDADVVNCSGAGLTNTTSVTIPARTRVVILDSNHFVELNSSALFSKSNLSHVEILSIAFNNLSSLDSDSFLRLPNLRDLRLDRNNIVNLSAELFLHNTQLKKLNLAKNPLNIESTAESLQHLTSLYRLDLSGCLTGVPFLPELFANLTGLHELIIRDLSLPNITAEFFHSLSNLPLRHVDLARSVIGVVDEEYFSPFKHAEELILANATIEVDQLENLLSGFRNGSIQAINLNDVFVFDGHEYVLTTETFRHLEGTKIRRLHLNGNYAGLRGKIHGKLFQTLKSLNELHLDRCDIRSVPGDSFRGLHHLKVLSLNRNLVSCTRESDCRFLTSGVQLKSLHSLDFSNNLLSEVDNTLTFLETTFPQLAHLNLRWNRISSIPSDMFGKLENLLTLDLSDNPIREISPDAFVGLSSLRKIDIENCQFLTKIRAGVFSQLTNLKILNLQNSGLAHIHHGAFNHLVHLEELYLRNNRLWESGDAIKRITLHKSSLKVLDLGGNKLTNIPIGLTETSYGLKFLNLDNNYLSDCYELLTLSQSTLEFLDISSNSFVQPTAECFEKLRHLKMVNVAGNPFYCSCQTQNFVDWLNGPSLTIEQRPKYLCAAPEAYSGINLFDAKYSGWECHGRMALMATMAVLTAVILALGAILMGFHLLLKRKPDIALNSRHCSHSITSDGGRNQSLNGDTAPACINRYLPLEEEDCRTTEVILNGELLDREHRRQARGERQDSNTICRNEVPIVPFRRSNPTRIRTSANGHCYNDATRCVSRDSSIRLISDDVDNDEISVTSVQDQYIKLEANMEDTV